MNITTEILNGVWDDDLDKIIRSAKARKVSLVSAELRVGAVITISNKVRPKYLAGEEAEVVQMPGGKRTKLGVKMLNPEGARRFGNGTISLPMDLVGDVVS